jgi:RNA polymerase sigma-70 factor (ECF subfamily)
MSERRDADPLSDLARAAAAGDPHAIRDLVHQVAPAMLRAIRKVLGPFATDLEDVAQEATHGFVQALATFRGGCTVMHFACRVAVLSALAWRRRAGLAAQWTADVPSAIDQSKAAQPSPVEEVVAARRREALAMLLEELPPAQAEVLVLHCAFGFTVDEIAASAGRPGETIRSRLRLAKQTLRHRIDANADLAEILKVTL